MQHLIEALLTYARVNTEKQVVTEANIQVVIAGILVDLHTLIEENHAQITLNGIPNRIYADQTKMRRLFQNLIQNAIKFHKKGIAPVIHIEGKNQTDQWLFSVQDNGIGIAEAFHEKIFLLFRKLHNQQEYQGTGMGLALCKKIVEQHGGRIWLSSTPGEGTTFFFTIQKNLPHC